jgi:ribosomal protein L11 methylase PrmA
MHTTEIVNWKTFKEKLFQNPELDLQFQYAENKRIDASYHITEIKQAPITSVDCGGVLNRWTEIIIQLWEPENQQQLRAMKVKKALSIVELVEKALPLDETAIVKIEFGNSAFDTRQLIPNEIVIDNEDLIVDLRPDAVQCKAIDRGESCGLPAEKSKIELKNLAATACCAPGSGCC